MFLDCLEQWLCSMDIHSRNEEGSIEYDNMLSQFIDNIIISKEWKFRKAKIISIMI